jgi:hypothetical protein
MMSMLALSGSMDIPAIVVTELQACAAAVLI